jgi:hypothetical protein
MQVPAPTPTVTNSCAQSRDSICMHGASTPDRVEASCSLELQISHLEGPVRKQDCAVTDRSAAVCGTDLEMPYLRAALAEFWGGSKWAGAGTCKQVNEE